MCKYSALQFSWLSSTLYQQALYRQLVDVAIYMYVCSLVPRPFPSFSMLHAEMCSACNIEKVGKGLGMRLHTYTLLFFLF